MNRRSVDPLRVRLRSNPLFRLVPCDLLPVSQRAALTPLDGDRDFFGVLLPPPESGLPAKAVSHEAALLFLTLAQPACLPHLLTNLLGAGAQQRLQQLILDQVLQIELEGQFHSGPAACGLLSSEAGRPSESRTASLSSEAIAYGAALGALPVQEVATRLYCFNAAPSTAALQRRFASDDRLRDFLGDGGDCLQVLRSKWLCEPFDDVWLMWSDGTIAPALYKLYVSPILADFPRVFAAAVRAFAQVGCARFKVGRGAYGVLRPDKLVAYFGDLASVRCAAGLIQDLAGDAIAQGVPFSGPIDSNGLLSWGMDPPRFAWAPAGSERLSWRRWLSERIAQYVVAARSCGDDVQAFVRQRIALDGVDPASWTPDLAIWRGATGTEFEAA